jgi:hypothetical protein
VRAGLAVVLLLSGLGLATSAPASAAPPCAAFEQRPGAAGLWSVRSAPTFPTEPQRIVDHAIDVQDSNRWWVTNGHSLLGSTDGGCTFSETFRLPESVTETVIQEIVVAEQPGGSDRLYLRVQEILVTLPPSPSIVPASVLGARSVLRSNDGGQSFTPTTAFTDPRGNERQAIAVAPSNPDIVYVSSGSSIDVSEDGGDSWQVRDTRLNSDPPATSIVPTDIVIDRQDPMRVWLGRQSSARTLDGGRSWLIMPPADFNLFGPIVSGPAGDGAQLLFTELETSTASVARYYVSSDAGASFRTLPIAEFGGALDGAPQSWALQPGTGDVLITTRPLTGTGPSGVYRLDPITERFVALDDVGVSPINGATTVSAPVPAVAFFSATSLVVLRESAGNTGPVGPPALPELLPLQDVLFDVPPVPVPDPAVLRPDGATVRVEPGGSTTADLALDLPARPTPLDVYFVLDTSGSTQPYLRGLAQGLAGLTQGLTESGVDAQFGLAEFQDRDGVRYRQRADIRPPDEQFLRALVTIQPSGGFETGYTAVEQAVTGAGVPDPPRGLPVPVGTGASWREGALRTIVVIADEPFSDDPEVSSRDLAAAALTDQGVRLLALQYQPEDVTEPASVVCGAAQPGQGLILSNDAQLRCQLLDLAESSGAVAPAGGVSCPRPGERVEEGRGLVCGFDPDDQGQVTGLDTALIALLGGITDVQPVTLTATDTGGLRPEQLTVAPAALDTDVTQDYLGTGALAFTLIAACDTNQAGQIFPVTLTAAVAGSDVATATPQVQCGNLPAPPAAEQTDTAPPPAKAGQPPAPNSAPASGQQAAPGTVPGPPPPGAIPVAAPALGPALSPGAGTAPGAAPGTAPGTAPGAAPGGSAGTSAATAANVSGAPGSATSPGLAVGLAGAPGSSSPAQERAHAGARPSGSVELIFTGTDDAARRSDNTPLVPLLGGAIATAALAIRRRHDLGQLAPRLAPVRGFGG